VGLGGEADNTATFGEAGLCGTRGAPPTGWYLQQVTLFNIISLEKYRTQPRPARVALLPRQHYDSHIFSFGGACLRGLEVRPLFLEQHSRGLVSSVKRAQVMVLAGLDCRLSVATANVLLEGLLAMELRGADEHICGRAMAAEDRAQLARDVRSFCQIGLMRGYSWFYGQSLLAAACVHAARLVSKVEPAWMEALAVRCRVASLDDMEFCVRPGTRVPRAAERRRGRESAHAGAVGGHLSSPRTSAAREPRLPQEPRQPGTAFRGARSRYLPHRGHVFAAGGGGRGAGRGAPRRHAPRRRGAALSLRRRARALRRLELPGGRRGGRPRVPSTQVRYSRLHRCVSPV
jgi:hypothetical protein